jgi:hypothetical protein
MFTDADRLKAKNKPNLTLKQKTAVAIYLKTGNKSEAYRSVYKTNPKIAAINANNFFKKPKIVNALEKALKNSKFDDQYAVETLKGIVEAGKQNFDITRPDTVLKALETYFKITNKMGGGNKVAIKMDIESQAKKMDMTELKASIKELDKRQRRLLAICGKAEEGEII